MRLRLMPRFEQRLEEIVAFLNERHGEQVGRRAFEAILAAAQDLERFPRKGRAVPEIGMDEIREFIVQKRYRVIYRLREDQGTIDVVTVHHGALPVDVGELLDG